MLKRENWSSKLGIILAVAGSAIGLGNFLRFPVKCAMYGGGSFLIPYFISLLLLGIPLAWMEWTLGRMGGRYGHGSGPGILNAAVRKPWAKYLGSLGVMGPLLIFFFYSYIESWLLGFAWYSFTGQLMEAVRAEAVSAFFADFITLKLSLLGVPSAILFYLITFFLNFFVIYFGIRGGIETVSKIAMPVIFLLGIFLLVRVLTLPDIGKGLGFMWNPDFSRLAEARVWFEASGQVFFTLSVGIGAILTYASYVRKNQDIALSSLTACSANTFMEVILGGTIVVPLAIVIFGATNIEQVAKLGTFGLGFQSMPVIFSKLPLSQILQFIWFFLLFLAGLTSSISLLQPPVSFVEDELGLKKRTSVIVVGIVCFVMGWTAILGLSYSLVDELDFWGSTFSLMLFGAIEAFLFSWVIGFDKSWKELNAGANIRIPRFYKFILRWVTPAYIIGIFIWWLVQDGWRVITLSDLNPQETFVVAGATISKMLFIGIFRMLLLLILLVINLVIFVAWRNRAIDARLAQKMADEKI